MNKTKLNLLFGVGILVLFSVLVSATVTLNVPASSATVSGGNATHPIWNVTMDGGLAFNNATNCTFYAKSVSLTANLVYTDMNATTNSTVNQTSFQAKFNSSALEDGNDYSMYASCRNVTNGMQNSSANTLIRINNTIPETPSSLGPSAGSTDNDGSVDFSATVNGNKTTGCTLFFSVTNPGATSYAMTHSGNSCTKTLSNIPEQTYYWYIRASDGNDVIDASSQAVQVDISTGTRRINAEQQKESIKALAVSQGQSKGIPTEVIVVLVVLAIVGIVIYRKNN